MTGHRVIVEAGPGVIRQLCCATTTPVDGEVARSALEAIDDEVALLDARPVTVESLLRLALRSQSCAPGNPMVLLHPSWWPPSRVARLTAAAASVADEVLARPRSWLLARASDAPRDATVVVEIAQRLVAITGADVVAVPRKSEPHRVAQDVARAIELRAASVVIDAASAVAGAPGLAAAIADAVRGDGRTVVTVDDAGLTRLARSDVREPRRPTEVRARPRAPRLAVPAPRLAVPAACAVVLTISPLAVSAVAPAERHGTAAPDVRAAPTTFLVEGRVALSVPADWPAQRVLAGPGSARVQLTSPSDGEVALHVTQSLAAGETLSGTAEQLNHAIDAEPPGVFVDFNPSGSTAGRPAVTYREMRAAHQVRWTVFVDGPVRISIGCQSRPGAEDTVRAACEQAVRSAHAVG